MTSILNDPGYDWTKTAEIKSWNQRREMVFLYMCDELGLSDPGFLFDYLEVGTFEGASAAWMLKNTNAHVTTVDINEERLLHPHITRAGGEELQRWPEPVQVAGGKKPFQDTHRFAFYQGDSKNILPEMDDDDKEYDVIYIDGDHSYGGVYQDIRNAAKLLRPKGILICDDYAEMSWCGVYDAVNELLRNDNWEILLDNYVLWARIK